MPTRCEAARPDGAGHARQFSSTPIGYMICNVREVITYYTILERGGGGPLRGLSSKRVGRGALGRDVLRPSVRASRSKRVQKASKMIKKRAPL